MSPANVIDPHDPNQISGSKGENRIMEGKSSHREVRGDLAKGKRPDKMDQWGLEAEGAL